MENVSYETERSVHPLHLHIVGLWMENKGFRSEHKIDFSYSLQNEPSSIVKIARAVLNSIVSLLCLVLCHYYSTGSIDKRLSISLHLSHLQYFGF
jgi:hypothetical protein